MFIKLSHDSMFVCIWLMVGCNLCVELNVLSGYMYHVPVLSYRFPIIINMFPTDMFCSRYPVISVPFSRPLFPFSFPFPAKKKQEQERFGCFPDRSRPFSTLRVKKTAGWGLNFFFWEREREVGLRAQLLTRPKQYSETTQTRPPWRKTQVII